MGREAARAARLTDDVPSVLVARFDKSSEVTPIVRAAAEAEIVYVPLLQVPPAGRNTLQLY
ncbi:hypothetical protein, partial [Salmonella enterica]|uniref:hypothetical protein n=1 Tax=Salmonella enterica TaxID=28901 RepID=UPI0019D5E7C0